MANLTVSTIATQTRLATRAGVKAELGGTFSASEDTLLDAMLDQFSAAICSYCRRTFGREVYSETLPGIGDVHLMLRKTPVIAVSQVLYNSDSITDYSIAEPDEGTLYRRNGWTWTAQMSPGLSGWQRWPGRGIPIPRSEEPNFAVDYTAGYILPSQYVVDSTTVSVDGTDDSFNDSASGFPALLKAGDIVYAASFSNATNNGRHVVTGTPTAAKIVTTSALTTEAAGSARTLRFLPPANCRPFDDVEKACIEAVKSAWNSRRDDSAVIEKQAGPMRLRYSEDRAGEQNGLPPVCVGLLRPWVRAA